MLASPGSILPANLFFHCLVLHKVLLAVLTILCDQQLFAALRPGRRCVLLPHLLAPTDTQVQAVSSYCDSHYLVFGWQWRGTKNKPKKVVNCLDADNLDLVSHSFLLFSEPFLTSSADLV